MEVDSAEELQVPSALLTAITFSVSTEDEREKLSVLEIDAANEVTDPKLGFPNPLSQCFSCGAKDPKSCEGHIGIIKFPFSILHPYYISEVVKILNKVCPGCKSIRKESKKAGLKSGGIPPNSCKYCGKSTEWYPPMKFSVSSEEIFRRTAVIAKITDRPSTTSQNRRVKKMLAADYWDIIPKDKEDEQEEQNATSTKRNLRVLSHVQVHHLLKDVDPNIINKFVLKSDSVFLSSFPVTPNSHRVTEITYGFSNGQRLIFDERTRFYKKLVDFRGTAKELSVRVLDCLKTSKLNPDTSVDNDDLIALQRKMNSSGSTSSGLRWVKDVVLGKRNDNSFRMVVVGDPNIKLSEIGIPCQIAEKLLISEHLTEWNREKMITSCEVRLLEKGEMHVRREGSLVKIHRVKQLRKGDLIYRPLNDGDVLLINRPPSIHQHSLIALSVKILPVASSLAINPLCCSPFRGDFDGDCLHGYVPQSVDARVELCELIALDKQLTNAQSGRNLLSLSQDSLTAAHLVLEDGVHINQFEMHQLQMFVPYHVLSPAIVKAPSLSGCAWTGKQLISMLLPEGFDHGCPQDGVYISDGELISSGGSFWLRDNDGNLFESLIKHDQSQFLDFLYIAQEVFCEWLSMKGLSVSLSDLYLCSDANSYGNMLEDVSCGLQEARDTINMKQFMLDSFRDFLAGNDDDDKFATSFDVEQLCYERQRSAALSQASVDAFKHVFRDIQSLIYKYACKDNSLMAMFKSGSKGNLLKLVQHSMCLGLQHSLVPLSFRMPHELSCAGWNKQRDDDATEYARTFVPSALVESSFLTGLNPLECFIHSVTSRDSSFSDNADLPGTLTRRLMFFMRDIHTAYDGTVRNAYGNQLIQFSYHLNDDLSAAKSRHNGIGGQPVGSLAAAAISEAAYSALDQAISLLEKSPLLSLKNVLECGSKKSNAHKSMSLFLSQKLGRLRHGFECGALEVQDHLERVSFSDIVAFSKIIYSPQTERKTYFSPWVCHFHVYKEIMKKRSLSVHSVIDILYKRCKSNKNLCNVRITSKDCAVHDNERQREDLLCISVTVVQRSKNSPIKLHTIQNLMIPFLHETVIKGLKEIKKVDILWNDKPKVHKSKDCSEGELYLRVSMSATSDKTRLWNLLVDHCLPIMDMIDWTRSHPDNIRDVCSAYGIDSGQKFFLKNLESAICDVGKSVLLEHLVLAANCLSVTGEFVSLNARGWKKQREDASVLSPFVQACFSTPGNCFIKAAKDGVTDRLQGSLDALSWGKIPSVGTGQFDIVYSQKGTELSKPIDVYNLLSKPISTYHRSDEFEAPFRESYKTDKYDFQFGGKDGDYNPNLLLKSIRNLLTFNDIQRLSQAAGKILKKYVVDHELDETDKSTVMRALYFHPKRDEKIGPGVKGIKVINHPEHEGSRCFSVVRMDGTIEDFSYRKCVSGALEIIAPQRARKMMHDKY